MRFEGTLKFAVLIALLVVTAVFVASCGGSKANVRKEDPAAANQPAAVPVTTAAAIKRDLPRFFEATGSLAGDQQTDVAPQTSGKVVAVGVDIGSHVQRGQMLVRLDDAELKLRVDQAVAQVGQAKAAVKQAEEKIGLRPGQAFDPNRVAEVAAAKVTFDLAEKNLRRAEKLIESGERTPELFYNTGLLLQRSGNIEDAIKLYQEALNERPNFAEALLNLGHALKAKGEVEEARNCWRQALEFKPELAAGYFEQ